MLFFPDGLQLTPVVEAHLSANNERSDSHRSLSGGTFGLAWAREREGSGALVVDGVCP